MLSFDGSGEPSLVIGGLSLWILGDANSESYRGVDLQAHAVCSAPGATVSVTGPLVGTNDIAAFMWEMEAMHEWKATTASLRPVELNLSVELKSSAIGRLQVEVGITPDSKTQQHQFISELDLTYLLKPIAQCRESLAAFPVVRFQTFRVTP